MKLKKLALLAITGLMCLMAGCGSDQSASTVESGAAHAAERVGEPVSNCKILIAY